MTIFILDFETTGLNPYHDDIIDIGCKVLDQDITFQCLVKPESKRRVDDYITTLTGITNQMLSKQGKQYILACQDFINFIIEQSDGSTNYIISHNGDGFDFIIFKKILRDLRLHQKLPESFPPIQYIDTIPFAKRLLENQKRFSLSTLSKVFSIPQPEAHRALPDVFNLEILYRQLCSRLGSKYQVKDLLLNPDYIYNYIHLKD